MTSCGLPANRAPRGPADVSNASVWQELTAGAGHVVADVAGVVRVEGVAGALGGGLDVEVAGHPDPQRVGVVAGVGAVLR